MMPRPEKIQPGSESSIYDKDGFSYDLVAQDNSLSRTTYALGAATASVLNWRTPPSVCDEAIRYGCREGWWWT